MERLNRFLLIPALSSFFFTIPAAAHDLMLSGTASGEDLAFARYIASLRTPDPFGAEMVAITIDAWSPRLHQESRLLMLRRPDASGQSQYLPLETEGELAATLDLINPYLRERDRLAGLPASSIAITPENYKFRYLGSMETEDAPAYTFRIVPRQKRDGMIQGELWIDSQTGMAVAQSGYLVKTPSASIRQVEISEDTKFDGGSPVLRVTHIVIDTKQDGRGLVTITERRLADQDGAPVQPSTFRTGGPLSRAQ